MPVGPAPVPFDRASHRDRLEAAGSVDLLVVGGGITGAGVALLAARRGYRVALVERADLGSGTSSRSSKLIHGGARYLATGDVGMVAEGVQERDRLRRAAPHLVHPLPFLIPATDGLDRFLLRTGMTIYDGLAAGRGIGRHRGLDPTALRRQAPLLTLGTGGVAYWDARTDDARLVVEVARQAASAGAIVTPHVEVVGLRLQAGRLVGADLRDAITGDLFGLDTRAAVSATGVWAGRVQELAPGAGSLRLQPSKGVHLVFSRADLPVGAALVIPSAAHDRRRLFVVPWGGQVYVGTTDTPHDDGLDFPAIAPDDADYLCAALRAAFAVDVRPHDAVGGWAGLRPLLAGRDGQVTADLSRRHRIVEDPTGLLTITGGKLTTFAAMARDALRGVDRLLGGRRRGTPSLGPLGSTGEVAAGRARTRSLACDLDVDPALAEGLYHRHGDRAGQVLQACVSDGEAEPLVDGLPYLVGEVRWAARHEAAACLGDVLRRRLPVALRHRAAGGDGVPVAARVLADELGWDDAERHRQVGAYLADVQAERGCLPVDNEAASVTP